MKLLSFNALVAMELRDSGPDVTSKSPSSASSPPARVMTCIHMQCLLRAPQIQTCRNCTWSSDRFASPFGWLNFIKPYRTELVHAVSFFLMTQLYQTRKSWDCCRVNCISCSYTTELIEKPLNGQLLDSEPTWTVQGISHRNSQASRVLRHLLCSVTKPNHAAKRGVRTLSGPNLTWL